MDLEYEASDKHSQALLEELGSSEESTTVNSAAVKPEEIGQEEEEEMLEGTEQGEVEELGRDAKLHESGQGGLSICHERDMYEDGELDTRKLDKVEDPRRDEGLRASGSRLEGPERKSTSGGIMMINGTVVKHCSRWGLTCTHTHTHSGTEHTQTNTLT